MNNRKQQNVTKALFIIYLIVLTWIILFKMQIHITEIFQARYRNVNLVPFQGSLATNKMTAFKEIIMNVIIFVPYGVYISMLKENWNILNGLNREYAWGNIWSSSFLAIVKSFER